MAVAACLQVYLSSQQIACMTVYTLQLVIVKSEPGANIDVIHSSCLQSDAADSPIAFLSPSFLRDLPGWRAISD